jgi:hypothetical protein
LEIAQAVLSYGAFNPGAPSVLSAVLLLPMISADIRDLEHNNKRTLDETVEFQVASVRLLGHVALRLHLEAIERSGGGNVERAIVLITPR